MLLTCHCVHCQSGRLLQRSFVRSHCIQRVHVYEILLLVWSLIHHVDIPRCPTLTTGDAPHQILRDGSDNVQSFRGIGPSYFNDVCVPVSIIQDRVRLRSSNRCDLIVLRISRGFFLFSASVIGLVYALATKST